MPSTQTTQVDTDNAFDWDTIVETRNDAGILTNRETTFDNGTTLREVYNGTTGEPVFSLATDPNDAEEWQRIFTNFEVSRDDRVVITTFDNEVVREEYYADELGPEAPSYLRLRYDFDDGPDGGAFAWTSIFENFDFLGNMTSRNIRFDNGDLDQQRFFQGTMVARTLVDGDDSEGWDRIETNYTDDGVITSRETTFDNGVVRFDEFDNGVRTSTTLLDNIDEFGQPPADGGAKSWQEIRISYDTNGIITFREQINDNGVVRFDSYQDGTLRNSTQIDNFDEFGEPPADGGAKPWEELNVTYDANGLIEGRNTIFDNGVTRFEMFVDGVRSTTTEFDNFDEFGEPPLDGGANAWEQIFTSYNPDGIINSRITQYDDGVLRFDAFGNGIRASTTQLDNYDEFGEAPVDGGAKSWSEIITDYDLNGDIFQRETLFDNGVLRFEEFQNGVRATITELDNVDDFGEPAPDGGAKPWQEVVTNYDANGVIETRETVFDNGVRRSESFADGTRSEMNEVDEFDLVSWAERTTVYDDAGQVATRTTQFDNGIIRDDFFENGVRLFNQETDTFDIRNWEVRQNVYDADGDLAIQALLLDDGDEMYSLYQDGVVTGRLLLDTNESSSWAARVTEYLPDGPETTFYDNANDLPDPYLDFLTIGVA